VKTSGGTLRKTARVATSKATWRTAIRVLLRTAVPAPPLATVGGIGTATDITKSPDPQTRCRPPSWPARDLSSRATSRVATAPASRPASDGASRAKSRDSIHLRDARAGRISIGRATRPLSHPHNRAGYPSTSAGPSRPGNRSGNGSGGDSRRVSHDVLQMGYCGKLIQHNALREPPKTTPYAAANQRQNVSRRCENQGRTRHGLHATWPAGRQVTSPRPVLQDIDAALASGTTNPDIIQRAFLVEANYRSSPSHIKAPVGTPRVGPHLCPD
jgi:hypothetical protein